jgi:BirA family biotin operon repressor/biotin-[acetyl-CoA-carboxylase] ligase
MLASVDSRISEERIAGHRVLVIDETPSTNATALELLARGALLPGDAVLATRQTAGRGRRGRSWITVPGRSLAVSVLVDPPALPRPATLGLLAAVATCRALERRGAPALQIKWPNDIMRGEAKVGGLLLEQPSFGGGIVVGVGVNLTLRPGDLPEALGRTAGDVGLPVDEAARRELLGVLLDELDRALSACRAPSGADWGAEYRRRAWLPGRRVELLHAGRTLSAVVTDVSTEGDLILQDGTRLLGEHVELLRVARARSPGGAADAR